MIVNKIKLEVGKKYKNGEGEEREIVSYTEGSKYPYRDQNGYSYQENGCYLEGKASNYDLLEEVTEMTKPAKPVKVSYLVLGSTIVLNYSGKTVTLVEGGQDWYPSLQLIREGKESEIPALLDKKIVLNAEGLEVVDGNVLLDGLTLPDVLNQRLLQYIDAELPLSALVKFARKLRLNPSLNSRKALYSFLEHNGHPITSEGNFIAYRGVTSDFRDVHTRTFDNSIGSTCEMSRSEVDDNPNNTCSNGLHVACYSYANGFGSITIEVEVDPMDVVCVPTDYNGTKMRVRKFKVVGVSEGERTDYYVGDYGQDDEQDDEYCDDCGVEHAYCDC